MRHLALLFLVGCSFTGSGDPIDPVAAPDAAAPITIDVDAGTTVGRLAINEVAAGDAIDWFELVAIDGPVELSDYLVDDDADDFAHAFHFPPMRLAAGEHFAQNAEVTTVGFGLARDDELYLYRASDHALIDHIVWTDTASPPGTSFRRMPDATGAFVTGQQSKGLAN